MTPSERAAARLRSWETRRAKYGERGHASTYRQAGNCRRCRTLETELADLKAQLSQSVAQTVSRETSGAPHDER